jgi:hypothetical protein
MEKEIWLKRPEEWIKENPGKPTMYKTTVKRGDIINVDSLTGHSKKLYKGGKEKRLGIYAVICERSKRAYIGQSIRVGSRLRSHRYAIFSLNESKNKVYIDIKKDVLKYGPESIEFKIVYPLGINDDLCEWELNTMREFINNGYKLYNMHLPINNICCPTEHKDLITSIINKIKTDQSLISKINSLLV